ncbi:GDSL esterase/lipase 1-like [Rhodamnia argentea]|uniref:GDSL esterase/lipase 1-like n=1 Tax=Rhodamnia argentea TaxID=178133 RepID=A0A8B8NMM6_9MYRT|nr:GDSL esterase/lipase 1-like [Rhodamnia argentea]
MLREVITSVAVCIILLLPATCLRRLPENHVALFIFGDSLLDAGNNLYLNTSAKTNYFPYGETFFKHPTGRVCDGRIVPDFIAEYAKLPLIRPYLEPGFSNYTDGINFASAGAGILPETRPGTIHLKLQLSYFEEVVKRLRQQIGDEDAHRLLSDAIYLFSMGGNDYMALATDPKSSVLTAAYKKTFMTMVLGNFTTVIKEVYALGGRKFAFQNVGPIGCMLATRASSGINGCLHDPSVLAKMHNVALSRLLRKLAYQKAGFSYALFDYYTSLAM